MIRIPAIVKPVSLSLDCRLTFDVTILAPHVPFLLKGALLTAEACALALAGSLVIGLLVAALQNILFAADLSRAAFVYVDLFRNIPFIVQLFFFFYGLPEIGIYIDAFTTGVIALSIAGGAFSSDVIRSGILAIDTGILEAAEVSGLVEAASYSARSSCRSRCGHPSGRSARFSSTLS